jgi:hypothetical protein
MVYSQPVTHLPNDVILSLKSSMATAGNPNLRGRMSTVDLHVLISSGKMLFILKLYFYGTPIFLFLQNNLP